MARISARTALVVVVAGLPRLASLGLVGLVGGCAETSPSGVVVAPVATTSSAATAASTAAGDASSGGDAGPGDGGPDSDASRGSDTPPAFHAGAATAPARFRACSADADCVAVPRVGCCHNGWNEAVAVSQKAAYAASFVCPDPHPICAMSIVRDTRQPTCDSATHLCTLR